MAVDAAVGEVQTTPFGAALAQGPLQLPRVPASLVGHDGHPQATPRRHQASPSQSFVSSAMSSLPACQVLPESTLLTHTSAGANSAPSIL